MTQRASPFLMFEGSAKQAMDIYVSLFADSAIISIDRYGPHESGIEGSIKLATFTICGRTFMCSDSSVKHNFTFTPSFSIFVDLEDEAELDRIFGELAHEGTVFMPLDNYGFSKRFGWLSDRFGVSWQLNLPA
jgi:predicted 3-demethylubiquinone-9 3-methyltransferase (glyoxalase superfamily)